MNYKEEINKRAMALYPILGCDIPNPNIFANKAYVRGALSMIPIIEAKDKEIQALKESKWIRVEDGLPPYKEEKEGKPTKVTYVLVFDGSRKKGVYFPANFKNIEFEDWDDYSPESYPFTIEDKEKECVWLKEGWYEQLYHPTDDYYYYSPIKPTHWQPLPEKP